MTTPVGWLVDIDFSVLRALVAGLIANIEGDERYRAVAKPLVIGDRLNWS